jgi:hypothetical protein
MIRPALTACAMAAPAYLAVAAAFWAHIHSDRRAAAANRVRTKRLPRQLAERWADFDDHGRSY